MDTVFARRSSKQAKEPSLLQLVGSGQASFETFAKLHVLSHGPMAIRRKSLEGLEALHQVAPSSLKRGLER